MCILALGSIKAFGNNLEKVSCIKISPKTFFVKKMKYRSTHAYYRSTHWRRKNYMCRYIRCTCRLIYCIIKACRLWQMCRLYRSAHRQHMIFTGRRMTYTCRPMRWTGRHMAFTGRPMQQNFPKVHNFLKSFALLLPPNMHAYKYFIIEVLNRLIHHSIIFASKHACKTRISKHSHHLQHFSMHTHNQTTHNYFLIRCHLD